MRNLTVAFIVPALILFACKSTDDEMPDKKIPNPFMIESGSATMVVAHRGGRDLAPENTLVAFDKAVSLGVDVLEMDVAMTKDSILVTIHDLTIDRTADSTGKVIDYTFQELQDFNFGYHFKDEHGGYPYRTEPVKIPRLEDVFMHYPSSLMMIEIKDQEETGIAAAKKLNALIESYNLREIVAVFSFSDPVKSTFSGIFHEHVWIGASFTDGFKFVNATNTNNDSLVSTIQADIFAFPLEALNNDLTAPAIIEAAHRNERAIHYWTINKKEDMELLISRGADGIMTDKPDLLIETLKEMGFN